MPNQIGKTQNIVGNTKTSRLIRMLWLRRLLYFHKLLQLQVTKKKKTSLLSNQSDYLDKVIIHYLDIKWPPFDALNNKSKEDKEDTANIRAYFHKCRVKKIADYN